MSEDTGTWVYAVATPLPLESLTDLTGVDHEPVRALGSSELTAVVGSVGLERFGESALRRNLEDLRWLEACSRAHHRVVEALARLGPAVPMPLAILFHDDAGVEDMLAQRRADFVSALARVKNRTEWGVKVYYDRKAGPDPADERRGDRTTRSTERDAGVPAGAADAAAQRGAAGSGTAYLRRRKAELSAEEVARKVAADGAQEVHRTLARLAVATHRRPPQDPRLHGESLAMVLNAAYLLDDDRAEEFAAAAAELDTRIDGLQVELTGPWPPYSFATVGDPGG